VRIALTLLIVLIGTYVVLATFLYFYQDKFMFVPTHNVVMLPEEVGLTYSNVELEVSPGEIVKGWYFPVDDSANTVLFCYGNGGNMSRRMYTIQFFLDLGVNLFIFDYRGFGQSDGKPSESNTYDDAEAAYHWLVDNKGLSPDKIVIFGRSMGGGVATELATRVPSAGLVVESSFTSVVELSSLMFPYMFADKLGRSRFLSIDKIATINRPLLVTHSREDDMVPFSMGQEMYAKAKEPKRFVEFTGAHNDRGYYEDSAYVSIMQSFLHDPNSVKEACKMISVGNYPAFISFDNLLEYRFIFSRILEKED